MQQFYRLDGEQLIKLGLGGDEQVLSDVSRVDDNLQYYIGKFEKFSSSFDDVVEKINATENKGSYLAKLLLLEEQLPTLEAIGDFDVLNTKIKDQIKILQELVDANRIKNFELKNALLQDLKKIVEEKEWKSLNEVKDIQQKWLRIGKAKADQEAELKAEFEQNKDAFFENRKEVITSNKELADARIQRYRETIAQLEEVCESKDWFKRKSEIDKLIEQWKTNGSIAKHAYDSLFKIYKGLLDNYFDRLKQQSRKSKGSKEQFKELLEQKKVVLTKLLEYKEGTTDYTNKEILAIRNDWNNIGKVPGKILGKTGDAFYETIEYLFEFSNLNNFHNKKKLDVTPAALIKTMKRFARENEDEIRQFKENQEGMFVQLSNSAITNIIDRRLMEMEKKLAAKKKVISFLQEQ